jgi:hypothetical protein
MVQTVISGEETACVQSVKRGHAKCDGWNRMTPDISNQSALEAVRELEKVRILAIQTNDADAMTQILDDNFLYINSSGKLYDKEMYIRAVRTHELTYSPDFNLTETDHRVENDLIILVGMMLGHARLDGEQQVFQYRSMRVWRARGIEWKLLAWQSSALSNAPRLSGPI